MFIEVHKKGCNGKTGEQYCHGLFLIIASNPSEKFERRPELRAIVRNVRLAQCGHWMMGNVKLGKYKMCLSGAYGGDGLPFNIDHYWNEETRKCANLKPEESNVLFEQLLQIPVDLQETFWQGGGHNTCGKEAMPLRKWAMANIETLRKKII